jgi:hypothetical protein
LLKRHAIIGVQRKKRYKKNIVASIAFFNIKIIMKENDKNDIEFIRIFTDLL